MIWSSTAFDGHDARAPSPIAFRWSPNSVRATREGTEGVSVSPTPLGRRALSTRRVVADGEEQVEVSGSQRVSELLMHVHDAPRVSR